MPTFKLKLDVNRGAILDLSGFDEGVNLEGGKRIAVRSFFTQGDYRFYLAGRCYSWSSRQQLQEWFCRFHPDRLDSWAREMDGDMVVLVVDANRRQAYLISDRNGSARSYYYFQNGYLSISNSRQELIRCIGSASICSYAAYQLLTLGYIADPESLLDNVRVTMPGQIILAGGSSGLSVHQYYSPVQLECKYFETEIECLSALDTAYKELFQKRLGTQRIPCVMLSGGIDSLTLMKYLRECYEGKLFSLTYSFKNLYPNELEPARMAAQHFGTEHHEVVIDPKDAVALFIQNLQTDAVDATYLTSFAIKPHLHLLGDSFDLFTGQDTRLHTPPFDNPRELGLLLNRAPESKHLARLLATTLSRLLPHWPMEGSFKHYLQYWSRNLKPRDGLRSYMLEVLTPFGTRRHDGNEQSTLYQHLLNDLPAFGSEDSLQQIFKKYVAFEYRTQYTDDMNCLASTLSGLDSEVHCPFYDWQAVETSNSVPYHLGMQGDFTFKTWNKMPYVRKRIARLLVQDAVPDTLLYRAKKTCPHLDLIFNCSMAPAARRILEAWLPALLDGVDSEVREVIQTEVQEFSSKERFVIYDDLLLRKIQSICYLAAMQQICQTPNIRLEEELQSITGSRQNAAIPCYWQPASI